jgi:transposase InsO family protein
MDTSFCVEALEEALARFGKPEIFNTDQGSQFTSTIFTDVLLRHKIKISMDGRGRWMDNVFIERLWRSRSPSLHDIQEIGAVELLTRAYSDRMESSDR